MTLCAMTLTCRHPAPQVAQCVFEPQSPFVVETASTCEGLSRVAMLDGNTAIMLGKVVDVQCAF